MGHINSYPKVYALGHPALAALLEGERVIVQEKIDGSQFSFGSINGELVMRSKGADIFRESTDKLFAPAIATAVELFEADKLADGIVYRGEVISKPKHNTIKYDRVPNGSIILFDVQVGDVFMPPSALLEHALLLGLEAVPTLMRDVANNGYVTPSKVTLETVQSLLNLTSVLGGSTIEGVVIKNHERWGPDGKFLAGKHVSEAFKETHKGEWKKNNPTRGDVLETLGNEMHSTMRWQKAVQHLAERGELTGTPRDIGALIKEAQADIEAEERDYIAEKLLAYALPKIKRHATAGIAEWYKQQLMEKQFDVEDDDAEARESTARKEAAEEEA